ncbi:hypothetical protein [Prevotella sp. P5-108]|uniref:hypothetical protein n=1 Tax=Prevotella sp. P5-108 TaxID=2024225 RepID=UPI00117C396F|nr:hypothetical protein [Prevotella sp. P5-108]
MKKHLLTLVLITLVSLTANAQTVYESLKGQPVHVVSGNGTIDHSLSAAQISVAAPMCKAEGEGGTKVPLEYLFVNGADVPFGADGFPKLLALMRSLVVSPPINSNPMPIIALWVSHL